MVRLIVLLGIYLISSVSLMKIFEGEGRNGKLGWIPILRIFILFDILNLSRWLFIVFFIPFVAEIFSIYLMYSISKKFFYYNKASLIIMTILLCLLPPIGLLVIAYRDKIIK